MAGWRQRRGRQVSQSAHDARQRTQTYTNVLNACTRLGYQSPVEHPPRGDSPRHRDDSTGHKRTSYAHHATWRRLQSNRRAMCNVHFSALRVQVLQCELAPSPLVRVFQPCACRFFSVSSRPPRSCGFFSPAHAGSSLASFRASFRLRPLLAPLLCSCNCPPCSACTLPDSRSPRSAHCPCSPFCLALLCSALLCLASCSPLFCSTPP